MRTFFETQCTVTTLTTCICLHAKLRSVISGVCVTLYNDDDHDNGGSDSQTYTAP